MEESHVITADKDYSFEAVPATDRKGAVIITDYLVNRNRYAEDIKTLSSVNTGNIISVLAGALTGIIFGKGISGINAILVSVMVYFLIGKVKKKTRHEEPDF